MLHDLAARRRDGQCPIRPGNGHRRSSPSAPRKTSAPGIFHKLTGALTSHGLQIRSAQIHTLADGLVLDRFWVHDPDFAGRAAAAIA